MQAKDIADTAILEFLAKYQGKWSCWSDAGGTYRKEHGMAPSIVQAMPTNTPVKLRIAKMRQLIKRGLVGGCPCGCRGDYEITDKGLEFIRQERTTPYTGY